MVKLTSRKIPTSANRHWKKSRCSKSTVTIIHSNMTHAFVLFSSQKKIFRCRLDKWRLLQLLNFEQDVNKGCDWEGLCFRRRAGCQPTLVMWKPLLGLTRLQGTIKRHWAKYHGKMRMLQWIYASKGGGQGKGHPWCIEHSIYIGSIQFWWWALSAGTNQTLAKKRVKKHG